MAVDAIAARWSFGAERARFSSLAREGEIPTADGPVRALILKPQTFYNESGRAVAEALKFYKLTPADVVVFYDEIDLAPGRFRMKTGGGAAGNNGIRSITAHIGPDFRRARLGTGHPGHKDRVMGHVLSDFHKVELGWVKGLDGRLRRGRCPCSPPARTSATRPRCCASPRRKSSIRKPPPASRIDPIDLAVR